MAPVEWSVLSGEAVETVVGFMLCRENPEAMRIKPSRGDGGIDILVPVSGHPGKVEIYQVKSFTGNGHTQLSNSQKRQIRGSLERLRTYCAETGLEVVDWYLALPMLPTNETRTWFEELVATQPFTCHWRGRDHLDVLAARYPEVIDYYLHGGRERLSGAMTSMASALLLAQRAARRPTEAEAEATEPAPLAPADTIDGLIGLHDLLNRDDPHYRYDLAVSGSPPPLDRDEPLLVAAVQRGTPGRGADDGTVVTIKVYARCRMSVYERPIPGSFVVDPTGDDDLARDLELFHQYGRPFQIPQGALTVDVDLPGGLGGVMEGASGQITPASEPGAEQQLYIAVADPDGQVLAEPLVDMQPLTGGVLGVYRSGEDHEGAFTIEMRTDLSTRMSKVEIRPGDLAGRRPHDLLEGLRFVTSFVHPNSFRFRPAYGPGASPFSAIPNPTMVEPGALLLRALIEGLATIQEFTTEQILVPDLSTVTTDQRVSILDTARLLRGEILTITWNDLGPVHMHPGVDVAPDERFAVRLLDPLTIDLADRTLELPGFRQTDIASAQPDFDTRCKHDDHYDVRLRPAGSDLAQFSYAADPPPEGA
ncbi:hypothetical protein [Pseudonocardia sp. ICBG162]|uniref:hypothetical protein n=1 Tax=Pseudonocardia sp. ICBG162 TaxID=2846761 RepID=UPI001CF6579E|nr:hypothetical protein [Pseudonocardia sp. ICBG162]